MCGIAGEIGSPSGRAPANVRSMLTRMAHRGPDSEGLETHGAVTLGHRRLSIIDVSECGRQPMLNEQGTIAAICNGEVYNYRELRAELKGAGHRFRSESDSEVIVHGFEQWGIDGLLARLRGMYAFAVHDRASGQVFLARDRLGIKPLYYRQLGDCLEFASEVRALRTKAMNLDTDALVGLLALGAVPSPSTYLEGVRCLPPGHYIVSTGCSSRLVRYWDVSYGPAADTISVGGALEETVRQHMVADVPVGVFLSSGVDSAGIVAMARRSCTGGLTTLTVTFPEARHSEANGAQEFARCFRTEHRETEVSSATFLTELPKFMAAVDQPTADGVNTYFVSKAAKEQGLTVVLSGLGGDEVFFGYGHYRKLLNPGSAVARLARLPNAVASLVARTASAYGKVWGADRWRRFASYATSPNSEGLYLLLRGFFPPDTVADLAGVDSKAVADAAGNALAPAAGSSPLDPANEFNRLEVRRYLHDQLLRDSDVFSMAHSLELRVPYLDHVLFERCAAIAPAKKVEPHRNKPLLVDAIAHPAVDAAARAPKRGFTFPFAEWMSRHSHFLEEEALSGTPLNRAAVRRCWSEFRAGRLHWSRAWMTTVLAKVASRN
ncbi:MAG: asparagine synthase (glutamine-hydrolyzing) [Bryobacteraceae bacterium]